MPERDERTGAELLREAARLMRERAESATPGPWRADTTVRGDCVVWAGPRGRGATFVANSQAEPHWTHDRSPAFDADKGDTEHIASWHPGVALAVADWLDETALMVETQPIWRGIPPDHATAVARAYLAAPVSAGEPKEDAHG